MSGLDSPRIEVPSTRTAARELHPFVAFGALSAGAIAAAAIGGWISGTWFLRSILPTAVEMKFNTAICLIAAAASLLLARSHRTTASRWMLLPLWILAGGSALEYLIGIDLGIDQLLFVEPSPRTAAPGRISFFTAVALLSLGFAIVGLRRSSRVALRASRVSATIAVSISAFVLLGYIFGAAEFFQLHSHTPMAVNTAAAIQLLALGTIACSGRDGWTNLLFYSRSTVGRMSRRLIISGVAGTTILGVVRIWGQQQGLFSFGYGITLMSTTQIMLVSLLVVWGASIVERESSMRHAREEELRISEDRYRLAVAATNDRIYSWDMRAGVEEGNDSAADRSTWNARIHPDDRSRIVRSFAEALESDLNVWSAEYRIRDDEGRYSTVLERSYVVRDGEGRPVRAVGALSDVTKLREAESVLRDAHTALESRVAERTRELDLTNTTLRREIAERQRIAEELRRERDFASALMESSGALLMVVDRNLNVTRFNHSCEQLTGRSAIEVEGRPFYETLVPEEERSAVVGVARTIFEGDFPNTFENHWLTRSGERRLISWKNTALLDKHGEVQVIVSSGMDITDERLTQAKLEEQRDQLSALAEALQASNRELEAFSYSVSHDLRAPLRAMDGFSQALLEDYGESLEPSARDYLARIRRAAQRMSELIDGLLTLSRVSRQDLQRTRVDLGEAAQEIVDRLRAQDPARSAEVTIASGVTAWGDARLLRALLSNLLENAWKFTQNCDMTRIEFGVTDARPREYFVRDNGAGFDPAYAAKLFTPFQRLHSATDFPGTGIGLATVMRIIRRHGGTVRAESESGRGATFYFTLGEPLP